MNWVERRIKQERAISQGAQVLWQQLATAINDAVQSYNLQYGEPHGEISVEPNGKRLWLKRKAYRKIGPNGYRHDEIADAVSMDTEKATVSITGTESHQREISINVRDGSDDIFLSSADHEITLDEASKILIEHFLFDRTNSKKPRS